MWQRAVIVFLHDFYDSPHVLSRPSFFSGLFGAGRASLSIRFQRARAIKFYAKPHPNQGSHASSRGARGSWRRDIPGLPLLSERITNVQLGGPQAILCGFTVYGSVEPRARIFLSVSERIACGARHPHQLFEFLSYRAVLLSSYRRIDLLTPEQKCPSRKRRCADKGGLAFLLHAQSAWRREVLSLRQRFVCRVFLEDLQYINGLRRPLLNTRSFQELCDSSPVSLGAYRADVASIFWPFVGRPTPVPVWNGEAAKCVPF